MNTFRLEIALNEAKHKLLMETEWNDLASIGDKAEVAVRKSGKICIDLVDAQQIIGEAIDHYREFVINEVKKKTT